MVLVVWTVGSLLSITPLGMDCGTGREDCRLTTHHNPVGVNCGTGRGDCRLTHHNLVGIACGTDSVDCRLHTHRNLVGMGCGTGSEDCRPPGGPDNGPCGPTAGLNMARHIKSGEKLVISGLTLI